LPKVLQPIHICISLEAEKETPGALEILLHSIIDVPMLGFSTIVSGMLVKFRIAIEVAYKAELVPVYNQGSVHLYEILSLIFLQIGWHKWAQVVLG